MQFYSGVCTFGSFDLPVAGVTVLLRLKEVLEHFEGNILAHVFFFWCCCMQSSDDAVIQTLLLYMVYWCCSDRTVLLTLPMDFLQFEVCRTLFMELVATWSSEVFFIFVLLRMLVNLDVSSREEWLSLTRAASWRQPSKPYIYIFFIV